MKLQSIKVLAAQKKVLKDVVAALEASVITEDLHFSIRDAADDALLHAEKALTACETQLKIRLQQELDAAYFAASEETEEEKSRQPDIDICRACGEHAEFYDGESNCCSARAYSPDEYETNEDR